MLTEEQAHYIYRALRNFSEDTVQEVLARLCGMNTSSIKNLKAYALTCASRIKFTEEAGAYSDVVAELLEPPTQLAYALFDEIIRRYPVLARQPKPTSKTYRTEKARYRRARLRAQREM